MTQQSCHFDGEELFGDYLGEGGGGGGDGGGGVVDCGAFEEGDVRIGLKGADFG